MADTFSNRFDSAYTAWVNKRLYLECKPGFYWDNGRLIGEALDPCELESEAVEIYDAPSTADMEVF